MIIRGKTSSIVVRSCFSLEVLLLIFSKRSIEKSIDILILSLIRYIFSYFFIILNKLISLEVYLNYINFII